MGIEVVEGKDFLLFKHKEVELKVHKSGSVYLKSGEDAGESDESFRYIFIKKRDDITKYVRENSVERYKS